MSYEIPIGDFDGPDAAEALHYEPSGEAAKGAELPTMFYQHRQLGRYRLCLKVAAGGMAVLAGTPYAGVSEEFKKQAASDGSSSSGGCGSGYGCSSGGGGSSDGGGSSCSGGGCGGGCGG